MNITKELLDAITENTEYLETTEGDEVECIGIENLFGLFEKFGTPEDKETIIKYGTDT